MALVSVLLPTFARNASGLLHQAIRSVLEQDMSDLELLVVDDGSVDGSASTIGEFVKKDGRVRHIRFDRNIGLPALTTAQAFRQSSGEYIAWQFDDCAWMPHHLSSLLAVAKHKPDAGIIYGQAVVKTRNAIREFGEAFNREKMRSQNLIPNCSTLVLRKVYDTIGWADPSILLKRNNDYDLWVRASERFDLIFIQKAVAIEHGEDLEDSLGNSVSLLHDLAKKYMLTNRNEYLKIENMHNWKPFAPSEWMDQFEIEQFAFIAFEHFLRTCDFSEGLSVVQKLIPSRFEKMGTYSDSALQTDLIFKILHWYYNNVKKLENITRKAIQELDTSNEAKQAYIKELHASVLAKQAYIDELHSSILAKEDCIDENEKQIVRLSRFARRNPFYHLVRILEKCGVLTASKKSMNS
jgi:glycosyltransferase involved in cell wall biosynthesis